MVRALTQVVAGLVLAATAAPVVAQQTPAAIMRRLRDPGGGLIVVAHRGCHEAAPGLGRGPTPENSRAALLQCVAIGVEVMEADIRRSRDGALIVIHDDSVDRTTDGTGKVADLTLAQLKALRLRQNEGGAGSPLTDERILTLAELLALAKGRIVLNLDVKDALYVETIDAVERAGAADRVIVKTLGGIATPPLASMVGYDRVPFAVIPTSADTSGREIATIVGRQASGRVKPVAIELPRLPAAALPAIAGQAKASGVTLWVNSLWDGFVPDIGGDDAALRDPDAVWGALARSGVRIIQTDRPEALVRYRMRSSDRDR